MDYLSELNEQQKSAVSHIEGPMLIVAGAGAGKTKTIAHRIVNLIKNGVEPRNILAVTFTNKAAREMSERIFNLIKLYAPEIIGQPWVSTFHTLGVNILRENAGLVGVSRYFSIIDKDESLSLVRKAMKDAGYDPKNFNPKTVQAIISKQKNNLKTIKDFQVEEKDTSYFKSVALETWQKYEVKLEEQKALDFDDLILKTVLLLQKNPEVLNYYQDLWKFIHIDEYQDTNTAQYELSRLLAEKNKNICVVGDSDQAIYGWRNADFRNILNFENNFSGTKVVLLEENYRSTKNILKIANQIISKNQLRKEKNLFTNNKAGQGAFLFSAGDESDEAIFVVKKIKELIRDGSKPSNIAVLYRTNFQSRAIEEACINYDLPYQMLGTKFYERKEIKDVIAFIRLSLNSTDFLSMERVINVPARGIGKATIEKITSGQESILPTKTKDKLREFRNILEKIRTHLLEKSLGQSIKFIVKTSGLEQELSTGNDEDSERLDNLKELVNLASRYDIYPPDQAIEKFLTDASLISDQDSLNNNKNGVKLMTIHAAKGLEFEHVFIVGLEQDLFPHKRGAEEDIDREEERRLFYVAITRAKEKVWLSYCQSRFMFGTRQFALPSEFLGDISEELIEFKESTSSRGNHFTKPQMASFDQNQDNDIVWECLKQKNL